MRIWLVPNNYFPVFGGVQTVVRDLAQTLEKNGHDVTILTSRLPCEHRGTEPHDHFKTYRYPFSIIRHDVRSIMLFMVRVLPTMCRLIRLYLSRRPDVVNVHYLDEHAFYIMLLRGIFRFPLILSLHGSDVTSNLVHSRVLRFTLKRLVAQADFVITPTKYLMDTVNTRYPAKKGRYVVVHNGINLADIDTTPDPEEAPPPYIIAVGRLIDEKGFDTLIQAFKIVLESEGTHRLAIIGDGCEKERLQELAKSLRIAGYVDFLGRLDRAEVYTRIRQSCFLVLPSRFEAFGVVLVEAMAHGKTVIASAVGGVPEIVENGVNGILVNRDDHVGLAHEIVGLIRDDERRRLLEHAALRDVTEKYDNDHLHARYLDSYAEAMCKSMGVPS